jgi:hypothetical protein
VGEDEPAARVGETLARPPGRRDQLAADSPGLIQGQEYRDEISEASTMRQMALPRGESGAKFTRSAIGASQRNWIGDSRNGSVQTQHWREVDPELCSRHT